MDDVCHAVFRDEPAASPANTPTEVATGLLGACPICGLPLKGRQLSACSSACRTARSRNAKRDELLLRVRAAHEALALAAAAVKALEAVAENATVVSFMGVGR